MAVAAGLLPLALAGRSTDESGFNSRICTPVVVFAAVAVVGFALRITATRFRPVVYGFLAFLAGYWVVANAFSARRQREFLEELGTRLLPLVRSSPGITVAVLPDLVGGYDLTPTVTFRSTGRRGPVSHLVWVPVTNGVAGDIEPYCVELITP
jgi:hypothetical protein